MITSIISRLNFINSRFMLNFNDEYFRKLKLKYKNKNCLDRSFLQYKSQVNNGLLINFILIFFTPFLIFLPLVMIIRLKNKKFQEVLGGDIIAVIPNRNILPEIFEEKNVKYLIKFYNFNVNLKDILFIYKLIFRYFFHSYFWMKCIYVIFSYSGIAKRSEKEVLVSNEYSFTSSVLTLYLNSYGKIVSNCMHGEKVLCQRDCFSTYDNFYIWDDYYSYLLQKMDVKANFIISGCDALDLKIKINDSASNIVFYLQGVEGINDLMVIKEKLISLSIIYGCHFFVKPHPRYLNDKLSSVFDENEILDIDFNEAIKMTHIICSNYSTVLFQAYSYRIKNQSKYPIIVVNDLVELPSMYIMRDKADHLFSEI